MLEFLRLLILVTILTIPLAIAQGDPAWTVLVSRAVLLAVALPLYAYKLKKQDEYA